MIVNLNGEDTSYIVINNLQQFEKFCTSAGGKREHRHTSEQPQQLQSVKARR